MVERTRRLRVGFANSSPGSLGATARPNYVGPSGNGLVERMNAGRKPFGIKGVREWAPLSVSRRRSRGLRKTPQWSAERRAGPRYGPAIPSADGRGPAVRRANGRGVPRLRISALRYPLLEGRRVRNRQFGRKPGGMRRAATLPLGSTNARRNDDGEIEETITAWRCRTDVKRDCFASL